MSNRNLIVATLYPDGELMRDTDEIGFACPNPILLHIQRVDTLEELKHIILRTMGALGDDHVCAMFHLHHKYGPRQVMELLAETRNVVRSEGGPSSSKPCPTSVIPAPPLRSPFLMSLWR
ncbi:hypothetical protein PIB30_058294 [Stylosanthes scabra]|uniref:Uncharacterized protein n=1 Tax=Stylosanthes scabra TaxID=79078 RepID=A0ABU6YII5_9FABA|nr:hypothetical protein [Stylosanthes scabra]